MRKHSLFLAGLVVLVMLVSACGPELKERAPVPEPTFVLTSLPTSTATPEHVCGSAMMEFMGPPDFAADQFGCAIRIRNTGPRIVSGSLKVWGTPIGNPNPDVVLGTFEIAPSGVAEVYPIDITMVPFEGESRIVFSFESSEENPGCAVLLAELEIMAEFPTPTPVPTNTSTPLPTETPTPVPPTDTPVPPPTPNPLADFGGLGVLDLPGFEIPAQEEGRLSRCDACGASGGTAYYLGDFRSHLVQAGSYTVAERYLGPGCGGSCDALTMDILDSTGNPVWSGYVGLRDDTGSMNDGPFLVVWNGRYHIILEKEPCWHFQNGCWGVSSATADHIGVCFKPID